MPSTTASWTVRPGWDHRAWLGPGPFAHDEFLGLVAITALDHGWPDTEAAARARQAYSVDEDLDLLSDLANARAAELEARATDNDEEPEEEAGEPADDAGEGDAGR